jgi:hypothetical protein
MGIKTYTSGVFHEPNLTLQDNLAIAPQNHEKYKRIGEFWAALPHRAQKNLNSNPNISS